MKLYYSAFVFLLLVCSSPVANAQTTIPAVDLNGYAWSSNTGWISLNCATGGAGGSNICATSNYKVTINANRRITGYAWSDNIGWIRFGGLSGFRNTTYGTHAEVVGTYPNLTFAGWARACAATASPAGTCDTMTRNPESGEWDGWIALRGATHTVSADMTAGMNTGSYAWGSTVLGWIDMFSRVSFSTITATTSGTGCFITTAGQSSCDGSLGWNISATAPSPNVHNVRTNTQLSTNRSQAEGPRTITLGTTRFEARSGATVLDWRDLVATCATGLRPVSGVCEVDPSVVTTPSITLTVTPPIVRTNERSQVGWTISSVIGSKCTLTGPGLAGTTISTDTGTLPTAQLSGLSTVSLTCTGPYGSVTESKRIDVIPVAQEV